MKTMGRILLAACLLLAAWCAGMADVVQSTGYGASYRLAVNEALLLALEQHDGVTLSATERATLSETSQSASARTNGVLDEQSKLALNDALTKDIQKVSKGRITGYTVLSDAYDATTKKYRVQVQVQFAQTYAVPGRDPDALRRMAVQTFRPRRPTFTWYGQTVDAVAWSMALANKLNVALTQTRKFTMLDRAFDAEVNDELARLSAANANPSDIARLNKKLGADYLVVGEITFNDVFAPGVHPITQQPLPQTSRLFAEITWRVLLAPTGQLKWTDVVKLDAAAFPAADGVSFISASAEAAATAIRDALMANILPFEIVAQTANGTIVIGEGGKSLAVGERLNVFALGEEVVDSRTGEVLDVVEEPVGAVEIVRVTPKVSYARFVEGDVKKMVVGSRVRRVPVPPAPVPVVAPATPVQVTPTGGVVTPF